MKPDRRPARASDTIANLGSRLVRAFGGEHPTPPLADALLEPALLAGVERIALVVIDSLGFHQLVRALDRGACPHLARLLATGSARLTTLRSVVPAGTAAALLRCNGIGTFVGEPTGGGGSVPGTLLRFQLPHTGLGLGVASTFFYLPEGGGPPYPAVLPHYWVQPSLADYRAGRDVVLEFVRAVIH